MKNTYYQDADEDTFGDINVTLEDCTIPSVGWVTDNTDCDDSDPDRYPGNPEVCDYKDNNCDSQVDEGVKNTYYQDADEDTFGDLNVTMEDCTIPSAGWVTDNTDCDDSDPDRYPGNSEACDGKDNDCNPATEDGADESWLGASCDGADSDLCEEGNYSCLSGAQSCSDTTGDDVEVCDGIDNDCDGSTDEGVTTTYYRDADGDGYGDINDSVQDCSAPVGYVSDNTDCDDTNPDINPAACDIKRNGIDEDCDGEDRRRGPACSGGGDPEICDDSIDNDGDGDVDCDDSDCTGDPACGGGCVPEPEICDDGIDNDCDGKTDCADKKDCRTDPAC